MIECIGHNLMKLGNLNVKGKMNMIEAVIKDEIEKAWKYIKSRYSFLDDYELILFGQDNKDENGNSYDLNKYGGNTNVIEKLIMLRCDIDGNEFENSKKIIAVINLFHECGHALIDEYIRKKTCNVDDEMKNMEIWMAFILQNNFLAYTFFMSYYSDNYWNHPCEITAQYIGINEAKVFFEGDDVITDSEKSICDYINWRCKRKSEYIGKSIFGYKTLATIKNEFEKQFIVRAFKTRKISKKRLESVDSKIKYSAYNQYKKDYSSYTNYSSKLDLAINCRVGVVQDYYLASLLWAMNYSKDYIIKGQDEIVEQVECIKQDISLSDLYDNISVFGQSSNKG